MKNSEKEGNEEVANKIEIPEITDEISLNDDKESDVKHEESKVIEEKIEDEKIEDEKTEDETMEVIGNESSGCCCTLF